MRTRFILCTLKGIFNNYHNLGNNSCALVICIPFGMIFYFQIITIYQKDAAIWPCVIAEWNYLCLFLTKLREVIDTSVFEDSDRKGPR